MKQSERLFGRVSGKTDDDWFTRCTRHSLRQVQGRIGMEIREFPDTAF